MSKNSKIGKFQRYKHENRVISKGSKLKNTWHENNIYFSIVLRLVIVLIFLWAKGYKKHK